MRILVTDGMDKTAMAELREMGHEVVEQFYEPDQLGKALRDFDVVVVRSKTKVRANHIDEAKGSQLKLIIRGGVGVDNIDVDYAKANGIDVKNTPKASSQSVAELAMGHMFSCARYISIAGHTMREDKWEKKAYGKGIELRIIDNGTDAQIMADGTLVCTLKFSEETGRKWTQNGIDRAIMLFKTVTMLGADGAEILTASDTYVSATESTIGWATRVADMRIDNVRVLMQTAQETTGAAVTDTEPESTGSVSETEPDSTVSATENVTTAPVPTSTGSETEEETGTEAGTTAGIITETVDDSLAIWIMVAVMLVAVGVTGGIVTAKKRRQEKE